MGWGETGAKSALPIWEGIMREGLKLYGDRDFGIPEGIVNVLINRKTGRISDEFNSQSSFMESFVEGFLPGQQNNQEKDADSPPAKILEDDDYFNL